MARKALRRVGIGLAMVLLAPVLAVALLFAGLNTGAGQRAAAALADRLTGGQVRLSGLSGRFPDALRLGGLRVSDAGGVWLSAQDVVLDWSPLRLLEGEARIDRLTAARLVLDRLPQAAPAPAEPAAAGPSSLPVRVVLTELHVGRLELGAAVAGSAAALSVDGQVRLDSLERGQGVLDIARLDGPGRYHLDGKVDAGGLSARLAANEPARGLVTMLAGLPDLVRDDETLALTASLDGPWSGATLAARLDAGKARVSAKGRLDLRGESADLDITASAPAMAPRPDLSWGGIDLSGTLRGTLAAPEATATLRVTKLAAFGTALAAVTADATAQDGRLKLDATLDGLRAPGVEDVFAAAPVRLRADTKMDFAAIAVTLDHALLHAHGTVRPNGESDIALDLPDLAPLGRLQGAQVAGSAAVEAKLTLAPKLVVDATGRVTLSAGPAPAPKLLGQDARFAVQATQDGGDLVLRKLSLDGAALHATAAGGLVGGKVALDWTLGLPQLDLLAPRLAGALTAKGHVAGPTDDLTATAELSGDLGVAGQPRGPVHATLSAAGLPGKPSGRIEADGTLDGAPLRLLATAARDADGALHLDIARADWKSAHAEGTLTLPPGATLPTGRVALGMTQLADLRTLLGQALAGSLHGEVVLDPQTVRVTLDATSLDVPGGAAVGKFALDGTVTDPLGARVLAAKLALDGLRAGGVAGTVRLDAAGPADALGLKLTADVADVAGAKLHAAAGATVDSVAQHADLTAFNADWRDQRLSLGRTLRVDFADGVTLDGLALRLGQAGQAGVASLDVKGRVAPALDLTASLRNLPAGLVRLFAPDVKLAGVLAGDARLTGPAGRPSGSVKLRATGVRMTEGPASVLKPATLVAEAALSGGAAQVNARVTAGSDALSLTGRAPLGAGTLDLRARGGVNLRVLNAMVGAEGRQVSGKLTLDASITGSVAAPLVGGRLRLAGGEVQDIPLGLRIHDIAAEITGDGQSIRLVKLTGQAGQGTIGASGTLSLASPMSLSLAVTANDAQLLASELVHGTIGADLMVQGALPDGLAASGSVTIGRTEIRIPDSLPGGVPTLDVRRPGDKPPPPRVPGPTVALDVQVNAPGPILVRGRGVDATLSGEVRVLGTSAAPRPQGKLSLQRGSYTLAGKTLTFTSGAVGFDGGLPVDPTLDFAASTTSGDIVATLSVAGHASAPTITLSSTPELPQDEVLAQLLFQKSAVSLGPLELAQIAAGLAQMAGGSGFDPLEQVRAGLGLDRLSVSGSKDATGQTTGATVEAGRSLGSGVYVGAKQNATGTGTQGTVEVDLGHGLKLQAGVGSAGTNSATGAAGNMGTDVGVTWQFDY